MKRIDLSGKTFGDLQVIRTFSSSNKFKYSICQCKCICGTIKDVRSSVLKRGDTRSCGCIKKRKRNHFWRGFGEISSAYWTSIKGNAAQRGLEFSISIEEGWNRFLIQKRCCTFTNKELFFTSNYCFCKKKQTASLDRINPYKGYTSENFRWVHKAINQMKMRLSDLEFISLCTEVTEANLPILEAGRMK